MRFTIGFFVVLFAASLAFAQRPTVVQGCVVVDTEVRLWPTDDPQRLDGASGRFLLLADDDLLDEISLHEGDEIEVTGHINPSPPEPSVAPPILPPPGGGFPGVGRPGNPQVSVSERSYDRRAPEDVFVVEEFEVVRPGCRGRF